MYLKATPILNFYFAKFGIKIVKKLIGFMKKCNFWIISHTSEPPLRIFDQADVCFCQTKKEKKRFDDFKINGRLWKVVSFNFVLCTLPCTLQSVGNVLFSFNSFRIMIFFSAKNLKTLLLHRLQTKQNKTKQNKTKL